MGAAESERHSICAQPNHVRGRVGVRVSVRVSVRVRVGVRVSVGVSVGCKNRAEPLDYRFGE